MAPLSATCCCQGTSVYPQARCPVPQARLTGQLFCPVQAGRAELDAAVKGTGRTPGHCELCCRGLGQLAPLGRAGPVRPRLVGSFCSNKGTSFSHGTGCSESTMGCVSSTGCLELALQRSEAPGGQAQAPGRKGLGCPNSGETRDPEPGEARRSGTRPWGLWGSQVRERAKEVCWGPQAARRPTCHRPPCRVQGLLGTEVLGTWF